MTHSQRPQSVEPARIGSGIVFLISGGVCLAVGAFGLLAGAGGSAGAAEFGGGAVSLGEILIVIGVVFGLFRKLEARLIEIQNVRLDSIDQSIHVPETSLNVKTKIMDDEAVMDIYGITIEDNKYKFREWRYDKLSDAVAYAKLA